MINSYWRSVSTVVPYHHWMTSNERSPTHKNAANKIDKQEMLITANIIYDIVIILFFFSREESKEFSARN